VILRARAVSAVEVDIEGREPSIASHYAVTNRALSPRQLGDQSLSCGTGSADRRISE
jgi:hypothetical protein